VASVIAKEYFGITQLDVLKVIARETAYSFSPCVINSIGAVGLIQFVETQGAKQVGKTPLQLSKMSLREQSKYVILYLKPYKNKIKNLETLYLAIFYPNFLKDKYFVILKNTMAYENNKGLDTNYDNKIDYKEASSFSNIKFS